jgi:hypothetical protein
MRKFNFLLLVLSVFSFVIISCSKEGPEGPPGPPGVQGPGGSPGTSGTANVIYSAWHVLANAWRDTTIAGSAMKVNDEAVTSLTATVISQGVVLAYLRISGAAYPLPFTNYIAATVAGTWSYIPQSGRMFYTLFLHNNTAPAAPPATNEYRWIVIPGGVLGGRLVNGQPTYSGYTLDQLAAMTYEEVCNIFAIPQ